MELIQYNIFLVFVVGYTFIAAIWDQQYFKIPNKLTLPMFFLGWIYQAVFNGLPGLGDGALGFLVGFGFLFILWIIGSAGGGDVKLLGGLSVWLGFYGAVYVFVISTFVVILVTSFIMVKRIATKGIKATQKSVLATGKPNVGGKRRLETVEEKQKRRIMAWALPVLIATWTVLFTAYTIQKPLLPWN